jgi:hypothetical protein
MQQKSFKFEVKSFDEETGEFEGIASAFRKDPDAVKDIVHSGSYTKTIQENKGEIMLTYPPHDVRSIVGKGEIKEVKEGLYIKGTILRGIQKGEEAYLLMKAGVICTLSIGYDAIKWFMKEGIRHLTEIKLYEVALVPGTLAADDQAVISHVKTDLKAASFEETMAWSQLRSMGGRLLDTLYQTIDNIMYESGNDKAEELDTAITAFHTAFLNWISSAVDAGLFKVNKEEFTVKAQTVKDSFKALLEKKTGTEPPTGTPAPVNDSEAAALKDVLDKIQADIGGVDIDNANSRIDALIAKI